MKNYFFIFHFAKESTLSKFKILLITFSHRSAHVDISLEFSPRLKSGGKVVVTKIHWAVVTVESFTLYPFDIIHVSNIGSVSAFTLIRA